MSRLQSEQITGDLSAQSSEWSDEELHHNSDEELLHSDALSLQTYTQSLATPPAVVSESTSSIFSKFLPDITILIARANSTNSTDITQEKATSLASTLSSIPSLKGISNGFKSADTIKQIIEKSKPTENSSGKPTDVQPPPQDDDEPPPPPSSARSSFQSLGDDGQDPLGSSSNAAQEQTSRAAGTASPPSARRRPAKNRVELFHGDDSATDDDLSRQSLLLSDDAASYGKGKSFTNRRQQFTSTHPSAVAFNAAQQRQQQNAHSPQAQAPHGAAGTSRAQATLGAAGAKADAAQAYRDAGDPAYRAAGARADAAIAAAEATHALNFNKRAENITRENANLNFPFMLPPPPSSFTPPPSNPPPPFTQPRYHYVDLTKGGHPGAF